MIDLKPVIAWVIDGGWLYVGLIWTAYVIFWEWLKSKWH